MMKNTKYVLAAVIVVVGIGAVAFLGILFTSHSGIVASASSQQSATTTPGSQSVQITSNIPYGPLADETFNLCSPRGVTTPTPVLLMIHGGAWEKGNAQSINTICETFAKAGIKVFNINYRLFNSTTGVNPWPDQLIDAQLAVRFIRANASKYNGNSNELCSWGESAGAHLAVFLGVLPTTMPGDEASLYANESPEVHCVVDNFGPVDLTHPGALRSSVTALVGDNAPVTLAQLTSASPLFLVGKQSAPMLIVQGNLDSLVSSTTQSVLLYQALQKNNIQTQYISYNGGHSFQGLRQAQIDQLLSQEVTFVQTHL